MAYQFNQKLQSFVTGKPFVKVAVGFFRVGEGSEMPGRLSILRI
jgi:hypothetical protein